MSCDACIKSLFSHPVSASVQGLEFDTGVTREFAVVLELGLRLDSSPARGEVAVRFKGQQVTAFADPDVTIGDRNFDFFHRAFRRNIVGADHEAKHVASRTVDLELAYGAPCNSDGSA